MGNIGAYPPACEFFGVYYVPLLFLYLFFFSFIVYYLIFIFYYLLGFVKLVYLKTIPSVYTILLTLVYTDCLRLRSGRF